MCECGVFVLFLILNRIWKSGTTAKPESLHAAEAAALVAGKLRLPPNSES